MELSFAIIGIIVLFLILKIFKVSIKLIFKFILNSIVGVLILAVANALGANIEVTVLNAFIVGILGIPGVILLLLIK
ncbi:MULTISPECIES: pro-sigmaK processing inhibitor BofA family protein [Helcococcus]|uniref:Pro-sigmaK processing inhibitor BofA family protein n=2 Tax=Helcococcus bovis TaxID=3153252 RepID=A0ABW9F8B0_9FIRM